MKRYKPLFEAEVKKDGSTWKTKSGNFAGKYKGEIRYFDTEVGAKEYASGDTGAKNDKPKSNVIKSIDKQQELHTTTTNHNVDALTKRLKPENYFRDTHERMSLIYIKDKVSDQLTPESKKKIEDLERGVKKHVDGLIKKNKSLQTAEKMIKKGYSSERIRGELSRSDPKAYDEMYKLMGEHFSEKGEGWFSGLVNFIKYVKGEE